MNKLKGLDYEKSKILRGMGQYESALELIVFEIKDFSFANSMCEEIHDWHDKKTISIFEYLLKIYFQLLKKGEVGSAFVSNYMTRYSMFIRGSEVKKLIS